MILMGAMFPEITDAQNYVTALTTRDGLSQGYISCLLQDREGFIWIGTKNGLNRYDGRRFEVFTRDGFDAFTLSNDFITALAECGDFLLVGTEWGGLNILHKKKRSVYRVNKVLPGTNANLGQCLIPWIGIDAQKNIWIKVQIPDVKKNFLMCRLAMPPDFWDSLPTDTIRQDKIQAQIWTDQPIYGACLSTDKKTLVVAGTQGLFSINTETSAWTKTAPPLSPDKPVDDGAIHYDENGRHWVELNYLINGAQLTDLYRLMPEQGTLSRPIAWNQIGFHLQHIHRGLAWVNIRGSIQGYRIPAQGGFDLARPEVSGIAVPEGFSCSMTDRSGLIWIGTNGLGLVKVNPRSSHFRHLFPGESVYSSILQDRHGQVLAYSNTTKALFQPAPGAAVHNYSHGIVPYYTNPCLLEDKAGNVWIAIQKEDGGVWTLIKTGPQGNTESYPMPFSIGDMIAGASDEKGGLWFGATGCLIRFDAAAERFSVFDFTKTGPAPHHVFALAQTADGSWWLGTRNGLIRAKPAAGGYAFEWLKSDPNNRNSLRDNSVASLLADPNDRNVLWIGTKGGGLNRLDTRQMQFTHLTTREGLPDNVIYSVLAENNPPSGETVLWMSSNRGLIRYETATGAIKNYTKEDGIQDNEFNTWAYGKGPHGELLFGGVNGMTVFDPRLLREDTFAPPVFITRLLLNGQMIAWNDSTGILQQGIEYTPAINLPFSRNNLSLEFVALHYAATGKNRFRYYLKGAEKEWAHESADNTATYLNLAPGTYTFCILGSNSEGVWSKQPTELRIAVLPPWYRTWWAWMAYTLIFCGSVFGFYRYQLNSKLEHAENQRLKELDAFKSRFFTNITHEFRTPLTVILGTTEQLHRDGTAPVHPLSLIKRNGLNLLRLINEILDLAKLESNSLQMHYVQGDVLPYLRYISESLHSMANARNILLRVESRQAGIVMDYDPERLLQIVYNLLSNAIKFTPSGGKVLLSANIETGEGGQESLSLRVADTGVGIPAQDLPFLFERFYQGKNQDQATGMDVAHRHPGAGGTGIGLSLTRELVKAMGGQISAESEPGKGSTFTVTLPISRQAPTGDPQQHGERFDSVVAPAMPARQPNPSPGAEHLPRLLIIEDNPDVVEYMASCLDGRYRLDFAYNGRAGIEKALETTPDLIISDVMMPEKDGFEVCDALKNDERSSHIPIVLLTARATVEDRIAGLRRGADAYLAKPFHTEELLAQLARLYENQQKLQDRYSRLSLAGAPPEPESRAAADPEDAFLLRLREFLEQNLSNAGLAPDDICRGMGMGRTNLHNKLTALTGMSLMAYLRALRLQQAQTLLRATTDLNISEVAYAVGFDDPKYFSRVFSEEFGITPSQFREKF